MKNEFKVNPAYVEALKASGELMANSFAAFPEQIASGTVDGKPIQVLLCAGRAHIYVARDGDQWVKFPIHEFLASAIEAAQELKAASPDKGVFSAPMKPLKGSR